MYLISTFSEIKLKKERRTKDWKRREKRGRWRTIDSAIEPPHRMKLSTSASRTYRHFIRPILDPQEEGERDVGWIVIDRATDVSTPLSIASIETYIPSCHRLKPLESPWTRARCPFDSKKFLHYIKPPVLRFSFPNLSRERSSLWLDCAICTFEFYK